MRRTFLTTGSPRQTEDQRWYVLQNWRQDVAVIIDEAAVQRERVFFSPYSRVFGMVAGDTGFAGDYGAGDSSAISGWSTAYRAYADPPAKEDLDGTIDNTDAGYTTNAQLGWDALSRDGSTIGYAGYVQDDFIPTLNHVRHRALKTDLGRWVQRDPAGYVDGANLYEYVRSQPIEMRDPMGLACGKGIDASGGTGIGGSIGTGGAPVWPSCSDPSRGIECAYWARKTLESRLIYTRATLECQVGMVNRLTQCCKRSCQTGDTASECLTKVFRYGRACSGLSTTKPWKDCVNDCYVTAIARGACDKQCVLCPRDTIDVMVQSVGLLGVCAVVCGITAPGTPLLYGLCVIECFGLSLGASIPIGCAVCASCHATVVVGCMSGC